MTKETDDFFEKSVVSGSLFQVSSSVIVFFEHEI